jgi:signal transduction histidine kinase
LTKAWNAKAVGLIYSVIGLPILFGLAYLLLSQNHGRQISQYKVDHAGQLLSWTEALPVNARFTQDYFNQLSKTPGDFATAEWKATSLPSAIELDTVSPLANGTPMARTWFKFNTALAQAVDASDPLVVYSNRAMGGPYSLWVNGELVFAQLDDWRMLWNKPVFIFIPNHLTKAGTKLEILLALPHRTSLGYALGSTYIGPQSELQPYRNTRYLLQIGLPLAGMLMIAITGLFSLGIWFKRQHESGHLWLFLLAASVVACNFQFTHDISNSDIQSQWFGSLVDSATSWLFLTFFVFIQKYSRHEFPKITILLAVFTAVNTVTTLPIWNWEVSALRLQHYILLFIYGNVVVLTSWLALRHRTQELIIFCILMWALLFAGFHDLNYMTSQLRPDGVFVFPYGAFALFFVAEYLLRNRYQAALTQIEQSNLMLGQKLKEREDEILSQQNLLQQVREQAVVYAERARLSRDIHDGIGSALTGAVIQLRSSTRSSDQAAELIQHCLDDIRLVMDSMESNQDDLMTSVASLRRRFADAFSAAGVRADWQIEALENLKLQNPSARPQLVRIIQEIIANCLKHAQAKNFTFKAGLVSQPDSQELLRIAITDDGRGFDASKAGAGRGLRNIRQRVGELSGSLDVSSSPGQGCRLCIEVPLPGKAER